MFTVPGGCKRVNTMYNHLSMLTTSIIAFREFFEAFLIVGMFLGLSRSLNLRKETEILLASGLGVALSMLGATGVYVFGDHARAIFTEQKADFLESYLLIFSGLFIAYVSFSLHGILSKKQLQKVQETKKFLQQEALNISLFLTILFLVVREGFEIALFTSSVSLFSAFMQNFIGLIVGFSVASAFGLLAYLAYTRFPLAKVFKATEYLIILLGAALTQNGITKLFETHFAIRLSDIGSLHLQFLPGEDSLAGHVLQGIVGVDSEFSLARLAIMLAYAALVYVLFIKKHEFESPKAAY